MSTDTFLDGEITSKRIGESFVIVVVALGGVGIGIAMMVLSLLWWSWWVYPAWQWFMVPIGVPHISFWQFVGLVVLWRSRMPNKPSNIPKETRKPNTTETTVYWVLAVLGPVLVWALLSWIAL